MISEAFNTPGEIPYESQIVFPSWHKMTAVISETDATHVLIVSTQNSQQISCWYLLIESIKRKLNVSTINPV